MDLPLAGITLVEMGHSVAAPFAGQIFGDLGARVVKVENPAGGDDARSWGPPFWHGASATFQSLNRNKLSVALDLKDPAECERLRAFIVDEADVVIQNMRPGLVKRLGLDDTLRQLNPRLVYCNLGAYGAGSPMADKPGYDPLMQAFGGIMSVTGEAGRAPVRVGPSIVDMGAGLWTVIGVMAALERRHRTGEGCTVDTSLLETALSWMTVPVALALASGKDPQRTGSEAAMIVPYKAYLAADCYLIIAAGNDALFRRLCGVLDRLDWATDPRFATNAARVEHREVLNALIDAIVLTRSADEWVTRLDAAGVPATVLQSVSEVLAHPQTRALDMVRPLPDGSMSLMSLPLRFDGERLPFRSTPPALGADNGTFFELTQPEPS
ncbi:CoA transferase [Caballeronia sp. LjRoot34]|jgi:crotonobetainyl-CoA:carnitine CoA-transferase CaiB-like acyl-CoA transferase|uniref:CaiB/BaiF CoA transferase family protein n=1 Tax=Caballeronia sp. LjRoot34 TaxID=3342325 RepID=UPI003ECD051D